MKLSEEFRSDSSFNKRRGITHFCAVYEFPAASKNAMADSSVNIFLICDYSILRSALRVLIESEPGLAVIGEAVDLQDAAEQIAKARPDLVLVDLLDFEENELKLLSEPQFANVPVLMLTGKHEIEFYQKCLKLGISGLVSKQNGSEILYKAISKVSDGELWFDRAVMGATIRHMLNEKQTLLDNPAVHRANGMTDREKQVVELICKGMKNKGIAEKLFITETTVRHHLTSIFNKLEVESRLELVIYAFKHQLIKIPTNGALLEKNGGARQAAIA